MSPFHPFVILLYHKLSHMNMIFLKIRFLCFTNMLLYQLRYQFPNRKAEKAFAKIIRFLYTNARKVVIIMFRIGQSTDIHQLVEGRKLIIGGVEIPHTKGLLGHSDADVLTHAIAESILGALALGDLGKHFPDTDPAYKDMDSIWMLGKVYDMMTEKGYCINNLDALVMIERPKMAPHIEAMRKNIANALHCDLEAVSIKATRGEKMGFVGREEGVQAQCVTLLTSI